MKNENKERKVLLPIHFLQEGENQQLEVLEPRFGMNLQLEKHHKDSQKFYAFDVKENGDLQSNSQVANLYLALVMAAGQKYHKAAYYLKTYGDNLSGYSLHEKAILQDLSQIDKIIGDKSGDGTTLQLYSGYLLLQNSLAQNLEVSPKELEKLRSQYLLYLNKYTSATVFKLQGVEELLLLKIFLNEKYDPILFLRLQELDPESAKKIKTPSSSNEISFSAFPVSENLALPKASSSMRSPSDVWGEFSLTRPYEAIQKNFLFFYEIARKGTSEEKELFKDSFHFLQLMEGGRYASMVSFFNKILEKPELFPEPPHFKKYPNYTDEFHAITEWKTSVISLTSEGGSLGLEIPQEKVLVPPQILQPFHLDKQPAMQPQVNSLSYHLPTLGTLAQDCEQYFQKREETKEKDVSGLLTLLDSFQNPDPVYRQEVERLKEDLSFYQTQAIPLNYQLIDHPLQKIRSSLMEKSQAEENQLKVLENKILEVANKNPQKTVQRVIFQIKKWGKITKKISLDEIIIDFARKDIIQLLQKNPALDEKDLSPLAEKIGTFLLLSTRHQQRVRAEKLLTKLEKCKVSPLQDGKDSDSKDLQNLLGLELLATRNYDPLRYPAYLAFEYFGNVLLRKAQVDKLETLLQDSSSSRVMEMIMGSGKSKVLIPLLGLLRADGETLSMMMVPQPLFKSFAQDTQKILHSFGQKMVALHFDRHTKFTKVRLEEILDKLQSVRKNKQCLVMTSKSFQCLILKFIEETANHFEAGSVEDFSDELKLLKEILQIFKKSGYPFIDEADTVLNVLHEVSFSAGGHISPKTHELEFLSEIYQLLYEDPELKKQASLESDPDRVEGAPVLTEQLYETKIKELLAEKIILRLGEMKFESDETLTKTVNLFIQKLSSQDRETLKFYLTREKNHLPSAQAFFNRQDSPVKDILALAGEEISHLLAFTLTRNCEEKYGLDDHSDDPLAIPYSASQTPSYGSQFANSYITMNYTFQTYMKKGVTRKLVENQIKLLQERAMREREASGNKKLFSETEAGKAFLKLKGDLEFPFFNYLPQHMDALVLAINSRPHLKRLFVATIILPQLERFANKMSCNPPNLVDFFSKVDSATGTLWNGKSMHWKLGLEPEKGTDAKTLEILWKNSKETAISLSAKNFPETLAKLQKEKIHFDMMADAGGYFKEGTNSQIAHVLYNQLKKEVVFYNAQGEQTITSANLEMPFSQTEKAPDERLSFLDQSHTTGADVPQKLDAVSLVTIGRNMLLRDLLQSVWRLRGLDKSQRVRFLINEEVGAIIRQQLELPPNAEIQLQEILRFVIANQAAQQGRDNYKGMKEGFANLSKKIFLEVMLNDQISSHDDRAAVFKELKSSWIQEAVFSAGDSYGILSKEEDADSVITIDQNNCKKRIDQLFKMFPWLETLVGVKKESCLNEIDEMVKRVGGSLPAKLSVPSREIEDDQTVEVEKETQTETQREMEVHESVQTEKKEIGFNHYYDLYHFQTFESYLDEKKIAPYSDHSSIDLQSFLKADPTLAGYADDFEGIYLTPNVLEWTPEQDDDQLLGPRRTDLHHLLVKESGVILLTQMEAESVYRDDTYYNLTFGFLDPEQELSRDNLLRITKVKFLNGESIYSEKEIDILREWFTESPSGAKKWETLFCEKILVGYPLKAAAFMGSSLQKLFGELEASQPQETLTQEASKTEAVPQKKSLDGIPEKPDSASPTTSSNPADGKKKTKAVSDKVFNSPVFKYANKKGNYTHIRWMIHWISPIGWIKRIHHLFMKIFITVIQMNLFLHSHITKKIVSAPLHIVKKYHLW